MPESLLAGVRVLDLAQEPAAMTGRIFADLGADVVVVEPPDGHALRRFPNRFRAWAAGKRAVTVDGPDDPALDALLAGADVVIDTPGYPAAWELDPDRAPQAVWVSVTPFGRAGPRSGWRASDLGVMAASGNMYMTGFPDRAPVRCTEPSGYAHTGPEAAFAAISALYTGVPHRADVAMQEVVFVANMGGNSDAFLGRQRPGRAGAKIGRSTEIWPTRDGFVSFGLRGGAARIPSLELITKLVVEDGIDAPGLTSQDWSTFHQNTVTDEELRAMEEPIGEYFSRHTMQELFDIACETRLMLAPTNTPREMVASRQFRSRDYFVPLGDVDRFPRSFVIIRSADGNAAPAHPPHAALAQGESAPVTWEPRAERRAQVGRPGRPVWDGLKILEFGSGAAGPIASRYFVEHGATVLRVESPARPDFLRVYELGPRNPHGLEGSPLYARLNVGKRHVAFNLKHPKAVELVKRLVAEWADAVLENYAPKAMANFGLDYDSLLEVRPDLVMISACLNGNTGPDKDYPGFGGQGSALSGFNWLTGYPDREPVGPAATITDSLAPRFVATALAAGLVYRQRTGRGCYLDVSQVEAALYTLSPWVIDYVVDGVIGTRDGNRSARAVPHGAFPCLDETGPSGSAVGDRWVAIAVWTDEEWARLAELVGITDPTLATFDARRDRIDEVEAALAAWTATRTRMEVVEQLQAAGIEAVPVQDHKDISVDPQVAYRDHWVELDHPFMGHEHYERNGIRYADAPSGYDRAGPTLGQDNDWVHGDLLGLSDEEREKLAADGVFD